MSMDSLDFSSGFQCAFKTVTFRCPCVFGKKSIDFGYTVYLTIAYEEKLQMTFIFNKR